MKPSEVVLECIDHISKGEFEASYSRLSEISSFSRLHSPPADLRTSCEMLATYCLQNSLWQLAVRVYKLFPHHLASSNSSGLQTADSRYLFREAVSKARAGCHEEAIHLFCKSIAVEPHSSSSLRNLALLLKRRGDLRDAKYFAEQYIKVMPGCSHGWNTYATILDAVGDGAGAISALNKSLELNPGNPNAYSNLAHQYHVLSKLDLAYTYSCKALSVSPDDLNLWLSHQTQVNRICSFVERDSLDVWKLFKQLPAREVTPFLLQLLTYCESDNHSLDIVSILSKWKAPIEESLGVQKTLEISNDTNLSGRTQLSIGFVSSDFRDHSVARFIWPIFSHLDRSKFRLVAFSALNTPDIWQQRFRDSSDLFYDISEMSEVDFIELVRDTSIDILFDLTGFTKGSRTYLFANRMAPVQISWLGFPGTTGLKNMDYLFVDRFLAPTNPSFTAESLLVTRGSSICFSGLADIPITTSLPQHNRGYITFGTLNNTYKITSSCVRRWASVMRRFDDSRFLFVRREFDSALLRENLINEFGKFGVDSSRLAFYNNRRVNRHYLDCYNEIDLTLDTYPVTGGTTTVDALWMGVPVVALEGDNIHQRVCSAVLKHLGFESWIATSDSEYIDIAEALANDVDLRLSLRSNLRQMLNSSILCDSEQFAADFADSLARACQAVGAN